VLVRTWNVFHGNTKPTSRRSFLEAAVRLAVADAPDVVCLQELPAWSLPRLAAWSGYSVMPALADPPSIGPLPSTPRIGRALTSLHPGFLRSAFSGQGNAVLAAPGLELREQQVSWQLRTCKHEDGFEHEVQDVAVELVVGAANADDSDPIEKAVLLALGPEQAFALGNLLIAAANQAPFLLLPDDEEDQKGS
jgi:hypothetical protein